jgi:hypothetical protein
MSDLRCEGIVSKRRRGGRGENSKEDCRALVRRAPGQWPLARFD